MKDIKDPRITQYLLNEMNNEEKTNFEKEMEISPARKSHPFWKSAIGSELLLEMIIPPESQLLSLHLQVYALGLSAPRTTATNGSLSSLRSSGQHKARLCDEQRTAKTWSDGCILSSLRLP